MAVGVMSGVVRYVGVGLGKVRSGNVRCGSFGELWYGELRSGVVR